MPDPRLLQNQGFKEAYLYSFCIHVSASDIFVSRLQVRESEYLAVRMFDHKNFDMSLLAFYKL